MTEETENDLLYKKLLYWSKLAQEVKDLKDKEMALRKELCSDFIQEVPAADIGKITFRTVIDNIKVKAEQPLNYKIDVEVLAALWKELSKEELECIKLKPTLVESSYKKLDKDALLHEAITTTLAAPTLTINPA